MGFGRIGLGGLGAVGGSAPLALGWRGWGPGSTGARLARLGLGSIGARARVDWASVHVNWSEGWIGAWLDWGVVGLGAAGSGTIVAS